MSWIWLDGVESFEKEKRIKAWKHWSPSFPTVYLVEMMAQAGALLLGRESSFQEDIVFAKIEDVKFLAEPEAGERLEIEVEVEGLRREGGWFQGRASQKGQTLSEGRVFLVNVKRLRPDGQGPITFPPQVLQAFSHAAGVSQP